MRQSAEEAPVLLPDSPSAVPSGAELPAAGAGAAAGVADRELAAACGTGDEAAWTAFTDRFSRLFAHVAKRTAAQWQVDLDSSDRDDIVAETLLACLRNDAAVLRAFAGRSTLATYLAVIARRIAARMLANRVATRRLATADTVDLPADPLVTSPVSDRVADRDEVERLLMRLDEAEARLVRLHHLEGRSYGEISRLTGMPLGSIGPALSRAKAKMRGAAVAG
jgi:RNA polymerase sigma-70 factor (ECF subfamily)